jgi:hypothetical protein
LKECSQRALLARKIQSDVGAKIPKCAESLGPGYGFAGDTELAALRNLKEALKLPSEESAASRPHA